MSRTASRGLALALVPAGLVATSRGALGAQEVTAQSAAEVSQYATWAPTLPGAPFLAEDSRSQMVLARLDALTALREVETAQENLLLRTGAQSLAVSDAAQNNGAGQDIAPLDQDTLEETQRILEARVAGLERTLSELEDSATELGAQTAQFGIGIAMFPVDEVRKPFWDDWGRPRSGGRSHAGTDVLAQVGVPLRAIEDGHVESFTSGGLGGNGIYLIGDSGSRYMYLHMDSVAPLVEGERVLAGQQVGTIGDTGNARGAPHLHMQWDPSGGTNWQNPFPLLDALFGQGRTQQFLAEANAAVQAGS